MRGLPCLVTPSFVDHFLISPSRVAFADEASALSPPAFLSHAADVDAHDAMRHYAIFMR